VALAIPQADNGDDGQKVCDLGREKSESRGRLFRNGFRRCASVTRVLDLIVECLVALVVGAFDAFRRHRVELSLPDSMDGLISFLEQGRAAEKPDDVFRSDISALFVLISLSHVVVAFSPRHCSYTVPATGH
jgi:hypothetical protein